MSNRTITAVFDSTAEAERAARDLAVKIGGVRAGLYSSNSDVTELNRLGVAGPDRAVLEESMRRGGTVLSATVPATEFNTAADVLETAGAVDLDAREAEWRKAGWSHETAGTTATGTTATTATSTTATSTTATGAASAAATPRTGAGEETIPLVEEQLSIGKRETQHGRVRVRSYVVETPVEEQVTLHQEHVNVERRPVDRPAGVAGADAFKERTIEATETSEEVVVGKEARVREEVVVSKTTDDETRTVKDTVRRTEVEVDDDRKAAGTTTDKPAPGATPRR
jgi:uncharacterized protein (TIGR02271 family)